MTLTIVFLMPDKPFFAAHLAYRRMRPLFWLFTRKNEQLERNARSILGVMSREGVNVPMPRVRQLSPGLHYEINHVPLQAVCSAHDGLIIVGNDYDRADIVRKFFIIGHELGHWIDATTQHRDHQLFALMPNANREQFADMVAWYCIFKLGAEHEEVPFSWDFFNEVTPWIMGMAAQRKQAMEVAMRKASERGE